MHLRLDRPAGDEQPNREQNCTGHHRRQAELRAADTTAMGLRKPVVDAVKQACVDLGRAGEADAERDVVQAGDADALVVHAGENAVDRREEDWRERSGQQSTDAERKGKDGSALYMVP